MHTILQHILFSSACQVIHMNPSHWIKKVNSLWILGSPKAKLTGLYLSLPFKLQYVVYMYVIKELAKLYLI